MTTLMQRHENYIAAIKANGGKCVVYQTPCCGKSLESLAAPDGENWDSLVTCPFCGDLFAKLTNGADITAFRWK